MVHSALQTQRTFLKLASTHQEPAQVTDPVKLHMLSKCDHITSLIVSYERKEGPNPSSVQQLASDLTLTPLKQHAWPLRSLELQGVDHEPR